MLQFPPTSPEKYVSRRVALNIYSPKSTGDWHSAATFVRSQIPPEMYICGEGMKYNTNHLLETVGVIDGTQRLQEMGYSQQNTPVWIADHPRAMVDSLYFEVLQKGRLRQLILDAWFPSVEDKIEVYEIIKKLEPKLNAIEQENLEAWKRLNPIDA